MSAVPGIQNFDRFNLKLHGSFGRYKTDTSHTLHYLTTTLRSNELDELSTAAETFDLRQIEFEELIQRDIDHARVVRMANDYLRAGQGRAVFFPPLLVCIAVLDEAGALKSEYSSVDKEVITNPSRTLRTVYDQDGFQLDLYSADPKYSDRRIEFEGVNEPFFDYAALLAINTRRTKLVVLDGQHRLQALNMLTKNPETRSIVASIEQPVCIVWMPGASHGGEHIVRDLRNIFVTVNSEPQRVSGHFILLLRDNSYSAATVRALADAWKNEDSNGWRRLHLLEWNTRDDQSTEQRQRPFSITTVSIVDNVLKDYLFKTAGLAPALLRMKDRTEELFEADSQFDYRGMRDKGSGHRVDDIIKDQIKKELVPALDVLLRQYRPYAALEARVGTAFTEINKRAGQGNPAAENLRIYLNRFVYKAEEMHDELARGAWNEFKHAAAPAEEDRTFFLAVYQQGMLRMWLLISRILVEHEISATDTARATRAALEAHVAKHTTRFLQSESPYARRVLWKNGNVNYSPAWAQEAWTDIQVATLMRSDVREALLSALQDSSVPQHSISTVHARLEQFGVNAAQRYANRLQEEITRDIKKNLPDYFGGEVEAGKLRELRVTVPTKFDELVAAQSRVIFETAIAPLADQLSSTPTRLEPVD